MFNQVGIENDEKQFRELNLLYIKLPKTIAGIRKNIAQFDKIIQANPIKIVNTKNTSYKYVREFQ